MNGPARLVALMFVVAILASTAPPTGTLSASAPQVTVTKIQPTEGDAVVVERVAAGKDYMPEQWRLVMDIWFENDGPNTLHLNAVVVNFDDPSIAPFIGLGQDLDVLPGDEGKALVPDDRLHEFPVPTGVTVELFFDGHDAPFLVSAPLDVYANQPTPMGSYRFPGTRAGLDALGDDCYWSTASDQGTFDGHHRVSKTQRFAYDLGVRCWSEEEQAWSRLRDGTDGSNNEDWFVFGVPLYAMADGVVFACTRDEPENVVGTQGPNGNGVSIQHGPDEYVNYAHMQQNTIPAEICVPGATITAGQYIGNAGNSGSSGNPHLHTQAQRGVTGVDPHDGRPQLFHNIRVLEVGPTWNWFAPPAADLPWHTTNGAAPGAFMLIDPLPFSDPAPWGPADEQVAIEPIEPLGAIDLEPTPTKTPVPVPTVTTPGVIVAIVAEPTPTNPSSSVPIDPTPTCRPEPTATPAHPDSSTRDGEQAARFVVEAMPMETPLGLVALDDGC